MREKLLEALPLLIGALLGVYFYNTSIPGVAVTLSLVLIAVMGLLAYAWASSWIRSHPLRAVYIWQAQALFPVAVIAASGYLGAWGLSLAPELIARLPRIELPSDAKAAQEQIKAIVSPLATAFASFFGALLLDDVKSAKGGFWPAAQIRKAIGDVFAAALERWRVDLEARLATLDVEKPDEVEAIEAEHGTYEMTKRAVYEDHISIDHPEGWGFGAAKARADLIQTELLTR